MVFWVVMGPWTTTFHPNKMGKQAGISMKLSVPLPKSSESSRHCNPGTLDDTKLVSMEKPPWGVESEQHQGDF